MSEQNTNEVGRGLILRIKEETFRLIDQDGIIRKQLWNGLAIGHFYRQMELGRSERGKIFGSRRTDNQHFWVECGVGPNYSMPMIRGTLVNALSTLDRFADCACFTSSRCGEHAKWYGSGDLEDYPGPAISGKKG